MPNMMLKKGGGCSVEGKYTTLYCKVVIGHTGSEVGAWWARAPYDADAMAAAKHRILAQLATAHWVALKIGAEHCKCR